MEYVILVTYYDGTINRIIVNEMYETDLVDKLGYYATESNVKSVLLTKESKPTTE